MTSTFLRSFWRLLPPKLWLVIWAALLAFIFVVEWVLRQTIIHFDGELPDDWRFGALPVPIICLGLLGLALWRANSINPAYNTKYHDWLTSTPWTPQRPLPIAPVRVGWRDWIMVAAVTMLAPTPQFRWLVPLAFLVPYCLWLGYANWRMGQDVAVGMAVALGVVLPVSFAFVDLPWLPLAIMLAAWAACDWGWKRGLGDFPWTHLKVWCDRDFQALLTNQRQHASDWWPLVNPFRSTNLTPRLTILQTLGASLLFAWIVAVGFGTFGIYFASKLDWENGVLSDDVAVSLLLQGIAACAAAVRLLRYAEYAQTPLSMWARLRNGRLLIPEYDFIAIAPVATMIVAAISSWTLLRLGVWIPLAAFISTFLFLIVALGLPPSLARWRLTGGYRMLTSRPQQRSSRHDQADRRHNRAAAPARSSA